MNRILEDMLRHYVNPRQVDWDTLLPVVEFAINNTYQELKRASRIRRVERSSTVQRFFEPIAKK